MTNSSATIFKKRNIKKINAGDIFAFKMDDGQYGFGRIVSQVLEGHVAEIFNYFADEPLLQAPMPPRFPRLIILNSYGMFQVKQDGDFGFIGETPNYLPDEEMTAFKFAYGDKGNFKSLDIFGASTPISDQEGLRLAPCNPANNWYLKKFVEHSLKGEIWPKPGIMGE